MNACVILAAGKGKRMKSHLPKVVHPVLGVPMVARVLISARRAGITRSIVVVGYGREHVISIVEGSGAEWRVQEEQLGTAHAVSCGMKDLSAESVTVLLGDVPLITAETVRELEASRRRSGAAIAVLTTRPPNAFGYGRIVRGPDDFLSAIVEHRDCTPDQLEIDEINTGLMSFDGAVLPDLLSRIGTDNDQGEYYLTDAVELAVEGGLKCIAVEAEDYMEVSGVNNRVQLSRATECLRSRVVKEHMLEGVDIPDPRGVWIEESVKIGSGVAVGRNVRLSGETVLEDNCILGDGCILTGVRLPRETRLEPYTVAGAESEE